MKKFYTLLLAVVCFHIQAALADPFLTPTIIGDNQVIGPTDTANFIIRLTNTGDAPFVWGYFTGTVFVPNEYNPNYPFPPDNGTVAVGAFLDVSLSFVPNAPPVALGSYTVDFTYRFYDNPNRPVLIQTVTGAMHWTVEAATVPEPTSLALLGIGLVALAALRRRNV